VKAHVDWSTIRKLGVAHLVNDLNQAAVVGALPLVVARRGLSYTAASGLVMASTIAAVAIQPVLGRLADRRACRGLAPAALVLGATVLAVLGLARSPAEIAVLVLVLGAVTAGFHPEAMRALQAASGARGATAIAVFAVCGHVGTAIGPASGAALVAALGMPGLALVLGPSLVVAAVLVRLPARAARPARPQAEGFDQVARWPELARLVVVLLLRSALATYLTAFVPLYLVHHAGMGLAGAGTAATAMLLVGALAAPLAGMLADRVGERAVLIGLLAPVGPLVLGFVHLPGALGLACLMLAGAGVVAPYGVALGAALRCLPGREGLAAGIAMGVASLGSVALLGFGALADLAGLRATFHVAAALPAAALVLAGRSGARRTACAVASARS